MGKVSISIRFPRSGNASGLTPGATVPAEPKSIADIKSYDQIVYWAWKKSADKINASSSVVKNIDILIGPNSGILNKNPLAATEVTSKLFAGFAQPTNISFVSFSFEDSSWAQSKLEELLADPELMQMIKSPNRGGERGQTVAICPDAERCHSSSPFTNRRKQSVVLAGYAANRLNNVGETQGELQAHEYTHVVQQHQFLGTAREMQGLASLREHLPWWLAEGGADFGGFAAKYYDNFSGYSTARMRDVYRVPKQTPEWFANFINPPSIDYWIQLGNNGDIYNIGFMVVEIFTAVKGPDAQMEITRLLANGKTMDEAFETVFSMPWRTAVPLIAELISRERGRF